MTTGFDVNDEVDARLKGNVIRIEISDDKVVYMVKVRDCLGRHVELYLSEDDITYRN